MVGEFSVGGKGISRKFQGCFRKAFKVLQGSFKGVYRKFQGASMKIKGYFKKVSRVFQAR